eukprot:Skav235209  [mRNA]  locus=scaffold3680:12451:15438:+ [translate_table: standard]
MDPRMFDDWGVSMSDHQAFSNGLRLTMEVMKFDGDSVFAAPIALGVTLTDCVRCAFPPWVAQYLDVGRIFTVVDFECRQHEGKYEIHPKSDMLLPILHPLPTASGIAEAFAGIGGWSLGATLFGKPPVLLIERDDKVAMTCAKSHGIMNIDIDSAMNMIKHGELPDHIVVVASITDPRVWFIAGIMDVVHWLASPPCPPWSNATNPKGLAVEDGAVFVRFAYLLGLSHANCATMENVPGLPKHPHYQGVLQAFREAGMKVLAAMVDKATPLIPVTRTRWLATCVRNDIHVDVNMLVKARNIKIPDAVPGIGRDTSMGAASVIQTSLHSWEIAQTLPSNEALEMMSQPELLPLNMRMPGYMSLSKNDVLRMRIKSIRQLVPNVMALQGSQHTLPLKLLQSKGLHAWLISHDGRVRFMTPFEIAAALGFPHFICLPKSFIEGWHIVGNSLSIVHAGLQCLRTKIIVEESCGLGGRIHDVHQLCEAIRAQLTDMEMYTVQEDGEWIYLATPESCSVPTTLVIDSDDDDQRNASGEDESADDTLHHGNISPTIPFPIQAVQKEHHDEPLNLVDPVLVPGLDPAKRSSVNDWALGTKVPLVGTNILQKPCDVPCKHGLTIVHLLHSQHIWASTIQVPRGCTIAEAIKRVLPHAKPDMFAQIFVGNDRQWFESCIPEADECTITFQPCSFPRIVAACFLDKEQVVEVDLTWTCEDLIAYVSTEAAVLPSAVELAIKDKPCVRASFVLAAAAVEYDAYFVTADRPLQDVPSPGGTWKRVTLVHPKWKSIRTGVFADHITLTEAVHLLCNESNTGKNVNLLSGTALTDGLVPLCCCTGEVATLVWEEGDVHTPILIQNDEHEISADDEVRVWVRSPFQCRTQAMVFPKAWTIMHLICKVMRKFKGQVTLVVMVDGHSIDPTCLLSEHDTMKTIELRVCPLQGGAKGMDATTKTLRDLLLSRGVKSDDVDGRIHLVKSKIQASELAAIMSQSEANAWTSLKDKG